MGARVQESILNMPLIYSARSIGFIIGLVVGTLILQRILYSKQKRCLVFFLATFLLCISSFSISLVKTFNGIMIAFFCSGIWMALVECAIKAVCLHSEIQRIEFNLTLYMFYGVGTLFGPLVSRSYVRKRVNVSWLAEKPVKFNSTASDVWKLSYLSSVSYVYVFISFLFLLSSLAWLGTYSFVSANLSEIQWTGEDHRKERAGRKTKFFGILNASLMSYVSEALAFSYVQILPALYVIGSKSSQVQAVELMLLFLGFFSLVQLLTMFVSTKMSAHNMLILGVSMTFVGSILNYFYVKVHIINFWISNAFLGFGVGPLFPCNYAWLCNKFVMNHLNIMPLFLTNSISELTMPWILSRILWLYVPNTPHFILVTTGIYFVLLLIQFLLLHSVKRDKEEPEPPVIPVIPPSILRRISALSSSVEPARKPTYEESAPNVASIYSVDSSKIFERISHLKNRVERNNQDVLLTLKKLEEI